MIKKKRVSHRIWCGRVQKSILKLTWKEKRLVHSV